MCVHCTRSPYGICPSMGGTIPPDMTDAKNHILLFTIFNPMYPITVVSWLAKVLHDTAHHNEASLFY